MHSPPPPSAFNTLTIDVADQILPILANDELNAFHISITSKSAYAYWVKKYLPRTGTSALQLDPQAAASAAATRALDAFLQVFPEMADNEKVLYTRARLSCDLNSEAEARVPV